MVPTIVYSTTRSWNCGDDFILYGVRRLVEAALPQHIPLVFNRNPEFVAGRVLHNRAVPVREPGADTDRGITVNPYALAQSFTWRWDNSVRPGFPVDEADACIMAGTPEWCGGPVEPLLRMVQAAGMPIAYLGLGYFHGHAGRSFDDLSPLDREILGRAGLVTVRDEGCRDLLAPISPERRPCPSLYASPTDRLRDGPRRIALCAQGTAKSNHQRIDAAVLDFTVALFERLTDRYDCALVCHYIDEIGELRARLGGRVPLLYSYDPRDYFDLYDGFDLTVTTRVHGAGLCASLGIPAVVIAGSARAPTVEGFLATTIDPKGTGVDEAVAIVESLDIRERSAAIRRHKRAGYLHDADLMAEFLKGAGLLRA